MKEFIPKTFVCFKEGYSFGTFRKDLVAGVTVGIIAIPLAMAFAIASGLTPQQGLYTAIIAGFLISLLGGSRTQIGGPTGAFVVIVYDIVQRQGYDGLVLATLIAGGILIIMGLLRLGTWIKYIPYPLVTGFTTGIAVIIFSSQIKDFFGLQMGDVPADFLKKWVAYGKVFPSFDALCLTIGTGTLALIIAIRRFFPVIPWGIASIVLVTFITWIGDITVPTIADRFGSISRTLPIPSLPSFEWASMRSLFPDAITIALLAAIESLLCAVVIDGMMGTRHKSNCELVGQGLANIGAVFFQGLPATAALARTATNVKSGAQTPVAGMIHALTIFLVILCFAPLIEHVPLPALSAILMMVAWNMSELENFRHLFKAPIGDITILLTAFLLTVFVDITVAVGVGMILAVFLFMKRMSSLSNVISLKKLDRYEGEFPEKDDPDAISKKVVPEHVEVYEITGPFFFGVADSLKDILTNMEYPPKVFILRMRKVPIIDASGMHALTEFYYRCERKNTILLLSGVGEDIYRSMKKYGLTKLVGERNIFSHVDLALARARELVKEI